MYDPDSWIRDFLQADERRPEHPDGRPLYAYRVTADELDELEVVIRHAVHRVHSELPGAMAQVFCLYASEWWRRHHQGGAWKWETIRQRAGLDRFPLGVLQRAVLEGLRRWQREVLYQGDSRMFLVTLSCEGGLPLHLIRSSGTALRRYFKHLLQEYQLFRHAGLSAKKLAAESSTYLPRRLRQDEVYQLSGQLIERVWALQSELRDADLAATTTPLRDLDQLRPDWRRDLPLELEDDTARMLLTNLVKEASRLERARSTRLYMRHGLERSGSEWRLVASVILPGRLDEEQWRELIEAADSPLPWRCELVLSGPGDERIPLALVSEVKVQNGSEFHVEPFVADLRREGRQAAASYALFASHGTEEVGPLDLPGAVLPPRMPWVFVPERNKEKGFHLAGHGSVSTRHPFCHLVFREEDWRVDAGEVKYVSTVQDVGRSLYEVRGEAVLSRKNGDGRCRIRTGYEREHAVEYRLEGKRERFGKGGGEVFVGMPRVSTRRVDVEGRRRVIEPEALEWRNLGQSTAESREPLGDGYLRHVEAGVLMFEARIGVLPESCRVELRPGKSFRQGVLLLEGLAGARLGSAETDVEIHADRLADGWRVELDTQQDPPTTISVVLDWEGDRRLELAVPYPSNAARFLSRTGEVMAKDAVVTLQWLAGIRANAVSLEQDDRFFVNGTLVQAPDAEAEASLVLREEMRRLGAGRFELDLGLLRGEVRHLLSSTSELDAAVVLRIESETTSVPPRPLFIQRFDLELDEDRDNDQAVLAVPPSVDVDPRQITVQAMPLWDPGRDQPAEVESLSPIEDKGRFQVDAARREAGPWLLLGKEGEWYRVRPLLWTILAEDSTAKMEPEMTDLQRAVCMGPDPSQRSDAIWTVLDKLAADPLDDDWARVFEYLKLLRDLPPAVLAVTVELSRHPAAAAMALWGSGSNAREAWVRLAELPFSWWQIPLPVWVSSARAYRDGLAVVLGAESAGQELRRRLEEVSSFARFMKPVASWIRVEVLGDPPAATDLVTPREILAKVLAEERQNLFHRIQDRVWPQCGMASRVKGSLSSPTSPLAPLTAITRNVAGFRHDVLSAPLAPVLLSVHPLELERSLYFDLRRLQNFDPEWFDVAYDLAQRWNLSILIEERPKP